jgi:hypothetical protein
VECTLGVWIGNAYLEQGDANLSLAQSQAPIQKGRSRASGHSPEQWKSHDLTIIPECFGSCVTPARVVTGAPRPVWGRHHAGDE